MCQSSGPESPAPGEMDPTFPEIGVSYWKTEIRITKSEKGGGWEAPLEVAVSRALLRRGTCSQLPRNVFRQESSLSFFPYENSIS